MTELESLVDVSFRSDWLVVQVRPVNYSSALGRAVLGASRRALRANRFAAVLIDARAVTAT